MQYSNNFNASNSYILMKIPEIKTNNNSLLPQINSNLFPTIIASNEVISQKPQYILIQEPTPPPASITSQSSDLMYKNIIQDIILQIFKNYSDIHNKLLLDKEFINNITIQISQKLAQETNLVHNLSDQISQELVKTLPKILLQDNDFSKDFIEKIYQNIKEKLQPQGQTAPKEQTLQQNNNKFKKPLPINLEETPSIDYLDYFYNQNKNYFDNFKSNEEYLNFKNNKFIYLNNNISTIFNEQNFIKFIESYKNKDMILAEKILKYFANLQIFTINDVVDNIKKIANILANKYYTNKTNLFIFILFPSSEKISDIINGSHFWILSLLYKYLKEEPKYDKERTFIVKDLKNLDKELKMKYSDKLSEYNKKYIFIDDAVFHGTQLSEIITDFININNINKESILPIIPFIHNNNKFKYKDQIIIGTEMINPFYTTYNNYNNIFNEIDLIIKLNNNQITTLTTLFGINDYNLPVIFEYNLGNSYNTYTCLFEYAPVFNNIIEIYNEKIEVKYNNSNWDDYCKEVIKQVDSTKFKLINSPVNNNIENIKIFNLPGEFDLNINTNKYNFCDKSSFIKKAYGADFYNSNSIKFIDIFDNINFIYDKNKDEIAKINNILTDLIKN
jgi:hypothetical protein